MTDVSTTCVDIVFDSESILGRHKSQNYSVSVIYNFRMSVCNYVAEAGQSLIVYVRPILYRLVYISRKRLVESYNGSVDLLLIS